MATADTFELDLDRLTAPLPARSKEEITAMGDDDTTQDVKPDPPVPAEPAAPAEPQDQGDGAGKTEPDKQPEPALDDDKD